MIAVHRADRGHRLQTVLSIVSRISTTLCLSSGLLIQAPDMKLEAWLRATLEEGDRALQRLLSLDKGFGKD